MKCDFFGSNFGAWRSRVIFESADFQLSTSGNAIFCSMLSIRIKSDGNNV